MQRFEVVITGEGLERALTALNDAGIPTMGPAFTWREGPSEPPTAGNLMFAVLDASAAEEAVARVSACLRGRVVATPSSVAWPLTRSTGRNIAADEFGRLGELDRLAALLRLDLEVMVAAEHN